MIYLSEEDFRRFFPGYERWEHGDIFADPYQALDRISRLFDIERFGTLPMNHRTNDLLHLMRVNWIADFMAGVMQKNSYATEFDWSKLCRLAAVHDDTEMVIGDIPSPYKRQATSEVKEDLEKRERDARKIIVALYLHGVPYREYEALMTEAKEKKTTEAQIVDVADKLDGLGETIHEIRSGNSDFVHVLDDYSIIFQEFIQRYSWWLPLAKEEYFKLNGFPTAEQVYQIPQLTKDRCITEDETNKLLLSGQSVPWYNYWVRITTVRARHNILLNDYLRMLMPSWIDELREQWKLRKEGLKVTESGIIIP